ncbi:MAG: UbiA family prenyltransferase [Gammaproteobacteria bacterium]
MNALARRHARSEQAHSAKPLVVDLDGSLLKSDVLIESMMALLRRKPLLALMLPLWLLAGRAHLKREIARRVVLDVHLLPYDEELLEHLRGERQRGRRLIVATGSDEILATDIAEYLGLFDSIIASDGDTNLCGTRKRDRLIAEFGERGFDYVGNEHADLPVWRAADRKLAVGVSSRLSRTLHEEGRVERMFDRPRQSLDLYIRALRLHQWLKNLLVLAPLFAAHRMLELPLLAGAATAFIAFGLCASSAYLLNDLLDLSADRRHPRKRARPFASADLALTTGLWLSPALLGVGLLIAASISIEFLAVMTLYYVLTVAYSFHLKRIVLLDAMTLSGLYGLRILAGAVALGITLSPWLGAFSMFAFLSLAMLKRFTELDAARSEDGRVVTLRSYESEDRTLLLVLGGAAGYLAVVVLALYVDSPAARANYDRVEVLWAICPLLLYWISHAWLTAHRKKMHDDPVVFAVTDRTSQVLLVLMGAVALAAV